MAAAVQPNDLGPKPQAELPTTTRATDNATGTPRTRAQQPGDQKGIGDVVTPCLAPNPRRQRARLLRARSGTISPLRRVLALLCSLHNAARALQCSRGSAEKAQDDPQPRSILRQRRRRPAHGDQYFERWYARRPGLDRRRPSHAQRHRATPTSRRMSARPAAQPPTRHRRGILRRRLAPLAHFDPHSRHSDHIAPICIKPRDNQRLTSL